MLYCGGPDQWAPYEHVEDLKHLQERGIVPQNITVVYHESLKHDFVVHSQMVPVVVDFCVRRILESDQVEGEAKATGKTKRANGAFLRGSLRFRSSL